MKRTRITVIVLGSLLFLVSPGLVVGQETPDNYFVAKLGLYNPTGDLDDAKFESSGNIELIYGHYFSPKFVLEGGLGMFHAEGGETSEAKLLFTDRDLTAPGIVVTPKFIHRTGKWEVFGGGGVGIYRPRLEVYYLAPSVPNFDETETAYGIHALGGATYDVAPSWYLGFEAKYIWISEVDFDGIELDLNGYMLLFDIGHRF